MAGLSIGKRDLSWRRDFLFVGWIVGLSDGVVRISLIREGGISTLIYALIWALIWALITCS